MFNLSHLFKSSRLIIDRVRNFASNLSLLLNKEITIKLNLDMSSKKIIIYQFDGRWKYHKNNTYLFIMIKKIYMSIRVLICFPTFR